MQVGTLNYICSRSDVFSRGDIQTHKLVKIRIFSNCKSLLLICIGGKKNGLKKKKKKNSTIVISDLSDCLAVIVIE